MAKNLDVVLLTDYYGEMLTENQRKFIDYYYNDDLSLSEIAENEGITRQGVRDAIKRAETQLFDMEKKLGIAERAKRTKDSLIAIEQCADLQKPSSVHSLYVIFKYILFKRRYNRLNSYNRIVNFF